MSVEKSNTNPTASASENPVPSRSGLAKIQYYLEEGLQGVERLQYRSVRPFITAINRIIDEFQLGGAAQYAVFSPVTEEEFTKIEEIRTRHYKGLRFLYLTNERTLIVKFKVGIVHEIAHRGFARIFYHKICLMGLNDDFIDIGRSMISCPAGGKEADTSFKPMSRSFAANWPTVVFECGLSESLERLRVDARWWLENSDRQVGTAIVVAVSEEARSIHVEKWELVDMPNPHVTRAIPDLSITDTRKTGESEIVREVVTGAPLKISFKKTMLRDPNEDLGEGDVIFDVEDFEKVAKIVWAWSK